MRFSLTHATTYTYAQRVDLAQHVLHLDARDGAGQEVDRVAIVCTPAARRVSTSRDHFGNRVTHLEIDSPHDRLEVVLTAQGRIARDKPLPATPPWERVRVAVGGGGFPEDHAASEFVLGSPLAMPSPALRDLAMPCFTPERPILDAVRDLTRRINREFRYDPHATEISTPLAQVLQMRAGVCQDFAQIEIAALRALGLAARYVSGYVATRPPGGRRPLRGADASHAWVSVWCGAAAGWIDVDPTNDLVVGDAHVVAAWGRDYADVSPVRGVLVGGGAHGHEVAVDLHLEETAHAAGDVA
jgi:transglutaminase-like putative cysteine protease